MASQKFNINYDPRTQGIRNAIFVTDPLYPGVQQAELVADPLASGVLQITPVTDPRAPLPLYFNINSIGGPSVQPEVQILGTLIGAGLSDTGTGDATNLLVSTQQAFSGLDWIPINATGADIGATAPDSTSSASTLTETTANGNHSTGQGFYTAASAAQYTFAISLKQGLRTRAALYVSDTLNTANFAGATFDLAGGAIGIAAAIGGTFSLPSATITPKSNGFYLCTITFTTNGSGSYSASVFADAGAGAGAANISYAGSAASAALTMWGAKVSTGTGTAYVPLNANAGAAASTVQQVFSPNGGTTAYWGTQTNNSWVGFDAGVAVELTRYRFAPRPSAAVEFVYPYAPDYAIGIAGALIQTDDSAAFDDPTTVDTIPAAGGVPYYPRYWLSERPCSASPARYMRMLPPAASFGDISALQFFAKQGTAANACPVQPGISPMGGRFPALSVTVTITTLTQGAAIYYTTDGSTPTTGSTLYAGPFVPVIGVGATVTIKAIAYLASLSTPTSLVTTSPPFCGYGYHPNDNWYDDKGNLIEAHAGSAPLWDPNTLAYYRVGLFMNLNTVKISAANFNAPSGYPAAFLYKSTDLMNWSNLGDILPQIAPNLPVGGRYKLLYNALNNNYIIWTDVQDVLGNSFTYIATAANVTGPWTWNLTPVVSLTMADFEIFIDSDGVTAYVVYRALPNQGVTIQQLNASYTAFSVVSPLILGNNSREGFAMLKYPNSAGGTYFIIQGQPIPYDSSLAADLRFIFSNGANPLVNSWSAIPGSNCWDFNPIGTNFNGQAYFAFYPQGKTQPMIGLDYWTPIPNYNSRATWLPLSISGNALSIQHPATWDPGQLAPSTSGSIAGSVVTFTASQNINLTTLGTGDWAAFGYNVNAASIERKSTGGSQISTLTKLGAPALANFNFATSPPAFLFTWTDGSPDASISNEGYGVYSAANNQVGAGMSFTVPASPTQRTLTIYVGMSFNGGTTQGRLTATLSDASALPYVDTSVSRVGGSATLLAVYTIIYKSLAASQTLTIAWTNDAAGNQNVSLDAAALQ